MIINSILAGKNIEFEEGTYTSDGQYANKTFNFSRTHTEAPSVIFFYDSTGTAQSTNNSLLSWWFIDLYKLGHKNLVVSSSYTYVQFLVGHTYSVSTSGIGYNRNYGIYNSDNTTTTSGYPRYYVQNTQFTVRSTSDTTAYFRSGRTYKWIACWI